jgi:hypothetical protein
MNKNIFLRQQIFFSFFDQLILSGFLALVCELRLELQKFTQADPEILRKIPYINV